MNKLGEIIKNSGLKKEHIAKELNVSVHTITNWVKGHTCPTVNQAQKLKEILNLKSIDELIEKEVINE